MKDSVYGKFDLADARFHLSEDKEVFCEKRNTISTMAL